MQQLAVVWGCVDTTCVGTVLGSILSREATMKSRVLEEAASLLYWTMLAACTVGPGTVVTCARAGAEFDLQLIWALLFASLLAYTLQEGTARLTIVSGRSLGEVGGPSSSTPRFLEKMEKLSQYSAVSLSLLMACFVLLAHWLACLWYVTIVILYAPWPYWPPGHPGPRSPGPLVPWSPWSPWFPWSPGPPGGI